MSSVRLGGCSCQFFSYRWVASSSMYVIMNVRFFDTMNTAMNKVTIVKDVSANPITAETLVCQADKGITRVAFIKAIQTVTIRVVVSFLSPAMGEKFALWARVCSDHFLNLGVSYTSLFIVCTINDFMVNIKAPIVTLAVRIATLNSS